MASPAVSHPASASSSSSSLTAPADPAPDVESQRSRLLPARVSHWQLVFHPSGLETAAVLEHKYRGRGTPDDPFAVEFLPNDAHNPMLFPRWKKWGITILQAFATLAVAFVSTAYSGGLGEIMASFDVPEETAILGISLFVVGFAIGPLVWAPASEFFGRQILFFVTYAALTAFNAAGAAAPSMASLVALRFLAGAFGSSPLTNSGGVIADMFAADERGLATAVFAAAPFLGPSVGPMAAGFLGETEGWRWVEGLMAIFTGLMWLAVALLVPETYAPVLLRRRAAALSRRTGRVYVSKLDVGKPPASLARQLALALSRPWVLLFREPIVFLTSLYMAIIYGTLYMMFPAFPIVFQQGRHWSPGVGGLAFAGVAVGMSVGVAYSMFTNRRYAALAASCGPAGAPPEARLPPALIGSVLLPVGLFWFAWSNGPEVHWIVPIIGSGIFASGIVLVFLSLMNYLIDSYVIYAASVLAANSVLRSLFGAAFPLFTADMYANLGPHWASSIPAFLAAACVPFPFLFYKYGDKIRMRCKFAAEAAEVLREMRATETDQDAGRDDEPAEAVNPVVGPAAAAAAATTDDADKADEKTGPSLDRDEASGDDEDRIDIDEKTTVEVATSPSSSSD